MKHSVNIWTKQVSVILALSFTLCAAPLLSALPSNAPPIKSDKPIKSALRIITLSPHLSEIVFALKQQKQLVAVSDYSNYPLPQGCKTAECKIKLSSVASYQGADIAQIIRLEPTIILAWEGGNKSQDIARLEQLGYRVFRSSPENIEELMAEVLVIGKLINAVKESHEIRSEMKSQLNQIKRKYIDKKASALYYMSLQPLSGMGSDNWLNSLLELCNITNIYAELPASYAQFSVADILRKQPQVIISASSQKKEIDEAFWASHTTVYRAKLVSANPDALHRFTPRALPEVAKLCDKVHY
ncbi:MAG: vitamin B12 transport system substrate-binding protein [Glaciecola sp.]|jgi:vitamin B12 transport system substrate-binding protein